MDGSVEGSTPAWTLDGPGRSKEAKGPVSELAATGLSGFYSQSKDPGAFSTTRRHFDAQYQANSQPSAEPSLCVGGTGGYYERRKGYNDSGHYRPHIKQFQPAIHLDKPDRRKLVADPTTKQELVQGIKTVKVGF